MSGPTSNRWALVERARGARPTDADRARIRAGLDARIAVAAAVGVAATGAKIASAAGGGAAAGASVAPGAIAKLGVLGLATKVFLACSVVAAVGIGAHVAREQARAPAAQVPALPRAIESAAIAAASVARAEADARAAESDVAEPSADDTTAEPAPEAAGRPSTTPRRARDSVSIAAEVKLLREAQAALKEGDAARSLSAIDTLAAKHPDGALQEERAAARVLALCAAGRVDEARTEARRFLAQTPKSVQAARVRASCAFAPAPGKK